jgi:hypothetical protein
MTEHHSSEKASSHPSREEKMSGLFAQLVLQQTNMALMLLGKIAHPESGQVYKDVDAARLFIDELEMLETKTAGNLSKEESGLLKQSLMNLRLAYVEAVESPEPQSQSGSKEKPPSTASQPGSDSAANATAAEDEHRKKFSKKY